MRVLIVSPGDKISGYRRYIGNLVKSLKSYGLNVKVASFHQGDYRLSSNSNIDKQLQLLVDKSNFDVVHIQYSHGVWYGCKETLQDGIIKRCVIGILKLFKSPLLKTFISSCKLPCILTLHDVFIPHEYLKYFLRTTINVVRFRELHRLTDIPLFAALLSLKTGKNLNGIINLVSECICLSETTRRFIGRGTVIYHGAQPSIDITQYTKTDLRKELKLPLHEKLLYVNLSRRFSKGYFTLNSLLRLGLPRGWKLVLHIPKATVLRFTTFSTSNTIIISGYLDDVTFSKLLFSCDAILLPYEIVGTSGLLFDALAHGLPFIASNLSFFEEFERKGFGLTFKDYREIPLLLNIIDENYESFKRKIHTFAINLKWQTIAKQHIKVYERVVR